MCARATRSQARERGQRQTLSALHGTRMNGLSLPVSSPGASATRGAPAGFPTSRPPFCRNHPRVGATPIRCGFWSPGAYTHAENCGKPPHCGKFLRLLLVFDALLTTRFEKCYADSVRVCTDSPNDASWGASYLIFLRSVPSSGTLRCCVVAPMVRNCFLSYPCNTESPQLSDETLLNSKSV